jgi:Sec-independent protein secretion pathway component TatC
MASKNTNREDIDDRELTFMEHLVELRSRLLKASLAILLVLVALLPFSRRLCSRQLEKLFAFIDARI